MNRGEVLTAYRNALAAFAGPTFKDEAARERAFRMRETAKKMIELLESEEGDDDSNRQQPWF